jgi:hypothetical protein
MQQKEKKQEQNNLNGKYTGLLFTIAALADKAPILSGPLLSVIYIRSSTQWAKGYKKPLVIEYKEGMTVLKRKRVL